MLNLSNPKKSDYLVQSISTKTNIYNYVLGVIILSTSPYLRAYKNGVDPESGPDNPCGRIGSVSRITTDDLRAKVQK